MLYMLWWGVVIGWLGDGFNVFSILSVARPFAQNDSIWLCFLHEWPNHHLDLGCSSSSQSAKVNSIYYSKVLVSIIVYVHPYSFEDEASLTNIFFSDGLVKNHQPMIFSFSLLLRTQFTHLTYIASDGCLNHQTRLHLQGLGGQDCTYWDSDYAKRYEERTIHRAGDEWVDHFPWKKNIEFQMS